MGFIMFRLAQVVRQYPAHFFGKIPGFNLSKLSRLSGVFPRLSATFLKVTNNEILTAKRHRSQLKALWCLRRTEGEGGGGR